MRAHDYGRTHMLTEIDCPICNGSRKMEIVEFIGTEKRKVKVPCTACGGRGKIPFVDLSKPQEIVEVENRLVSQSLMVGGSHLSGIRHIIS